MIWISNFQDEIDSTKKAWQNLSCRWRSTARRSYLGDMWWNASNWCSWFPLLQIKFSAMKSCKIERVLNNSLTSQVFAWKNMATANYLDTMVKQSSLNVIVFEVDLSVETPEIQMGKMGVSWHLGHCNERNPSQMESFSIWHKYLIRSTRLWITRYQQSQQMDQLGKPEMDRNGSFPRSAFENNSLASAVPSGTRIKSYMILRRKPDCKIWTLCPTKNFP